MKTLLIICALFPMLIYDTQENEYKENIEACANFIHTDLEKFDKIGCHYETTNSYILNSKLGKIK